MTKITIHSLFILKLSIFSLMWAYSLQSDANMTNLLGENGRWSMDLSTRVNKNTALNLSNTMHVVGLDIHKVLSSKHSDIGTLTFQPYLVKLNNVHPHPFFFDNENDTKLTWRIANFNYTAISQGKFNIRVGHFEIPFGLEYQIDTNGTLRQLTYSDRGIKADWGLSINGILPNMEYEVALTRGSGNDYRNTGNPQIFSGRLGTLRNRNLITGFSWFYGDVLGANGIINRKKIAVDALYYYYQWQFMFESSLGKTAENNILNLFAEAMWRNPRENLNAYIQVGYQNTENDNNRHSTSYWLTGVQRLYTSGLDISIQYKHYLKDNEINEIDPVASFQLRYRF